MLFHVTEAAVVVGAAAVHCVQKKHPLCFFITSSQINQFAQKFQHL